MAREPVNADGGTSSGATGIAGAHTVQTEAGELPGQHLCGTVVWSVDCSYGASPQVPPSDYCWDRRIPI